MGKEFMKGSGHSTMERKLCEVIFDFDWQCEYFRVKVRKIYLWILRI